MFLSMCEVSIEACSPPQGTIENYDYYADSECSTGSSWGQGIWCSVVVS